MILRYLQAIVLCTILLNARLIAQAADRSEESQTTTVTTAVTAPPPQLLVMLHLPAPHFRPDSNYSGHYTDDSGRTTRRRIALELANSHGLKLVDDWPMPVLGVDCYVMEQVTHTPIEQVTQQLERDSRVEWVQPMNLYHGLSQEDPLYQVQPSAKFWHIAEIHKYSTGRDVSVALIDSGVEENHPDLMGQIALKENFVDGNPYAPESHGTAVAGIIAARAGNGVGIVGIAPNARMMVLRACWEGATPLSQCSSFTLGKALNFAILHNARIINMSLAGPADRLLERLLEIATARGITVVVAVDPNLPDGGFPASLPGVIAVEGQRTGKAGSHWLAAPGSDIPTTLPGARWGFVSGSSYAAAHVSGMIALMLELHPKITLDDMRRQFVLNDLTDPIMANYGHMIDACATIARSNQHCICSCAITNTKVSNYP